MKHQLAICGTCRCHVRTDERRCPFCAADLAARDSLYAPARRFVQVRRIILAACIASVGAVACDSSNDDVQGSCDAQSSCAGEGNGPSCGCGSGGKCRNNKCVSCDCDSDEYCTSDGNCHSVPSGGGSGNACYGSPPVLGLA